MARQIHFGDPCLQKSASKAGHGGDLDPNQGWLFLAIRTPAIRLVVANEIKQKLMNIFDPFGDKIAGAKSSWNGFLHGGVKRFLKSFSFMLL